MHINLEEILDTIEARQEDMSGNRQLTNELVVDDLLKELGYNIKKDPTVKRLFNSCIDWTLESEDKHLIAVKVKALDEDISADEMTEVIKFCIDGQFSIILVTNGLETIIYNFKVEKQEYSIVAKINLREISEQDENVISAISKKGFSLETINNTSIGYEITLDEAKRIFEKNKEKFIQMYVELINSDITECVNAETKASEIISSIIVTLNYTDEELEKERDSFKKQILDLTHRNNEFVTTVEVLKNQIEELKAEIDKNSGASRQKALELMSIIDDSSTAERSYVAIINDEIIQYKKLHQFVGRILQKLYELKSFEANPYIHNGDIFKINGENPKYNDLVLNNKAYDVIITNDEEDDAISKLKTIFSHFEGIIFECKKLGNRNAQQHTGLTDEDIETDEERVARLNGDVIIDIGEKVEIPEEIEEMDDDELDIFGYNEAKAKEDTKTKILVGQLVNIDNLIWGDAEINFNTIKCIGSNSVTYKIADDTEEINYEVMTCKCIDAVMAIQEYNGDSQTVIKLKQKNFSLINNFIKEYSEEYRNYPRINGTKYVVVNVEDIRQVAGIVYDVCNTMEFDMTGIFMYFEAETEDAAVIKKYSFDRASIRLKDTALYIEDGKYEDGIAVIRGEMFNNIIITKNALQTYADVIKQVLAVKTKYTSVLIDNNTNFQSVVKTMLAEAVKNRVRINTAAIGYVLGEQKMILSTNGADVGEGATKLEINDMEFYCASIKEWQIVPSLIRLHAVLFNNANIAIKVQINVDAVNYYGSEFETSEPSTSLAIKSFVDYVANCVKDNKV